MRVSPYERLAYVSAFDGNVHIVDIADPFEGTDLIDEDGDGTDDRILGKVSGLTGAGSIALGRNHGHVGDTLAGKVHTFTLGRIRFRITDLTLTALADEGLPQEVIDRLEELRDEEYRDEDEFLEDVAEAMGGGLTDEDESLILKCADADYAGEADMVFCREHDEDDPEARRRRDDKDIFDFGGDVCHRRLPYFISGRTYPIKIVFRGVPPDAILESLSLGAKMADGDVEAGLSGDGHTFATHVDIAVGLRIGEANLGDYCWFRGTGPGRLSVDGHVTIRSEGETDTLPVSFDMLTVTDVRIGSADANFAPGAEEAELTCSMRPAGVTVDYAKMEVFKKGDAVNPVFRDEGIPRTGTDVTLRWDGRANLGDDNGRLMGPEDSPYTVAVYVGHDQMSNCRDTRTTEVRVESLEFMKVETTKDGQPLELDLAKDQRVYMNDPDNKVPVSVLVSLMKKDGSGTRTEVPVHVGLSFADPNNDNTPKGESFQYQSNPPKFLGKKGDPDAIHWEDHPDAHSDSADGYRLLCRGRTITDPTNPHMGRTWVWFKPSGVGGDDFRLTAEVRHSDGSTLISESGGVLTVWRSVTFDNIYEMHGEPMCLEYATEKWVQPLFDKAFVDYSVGPVVEMPPDKSVKYVGLWKNDPPHQQDWLALQTKKASVSHTIMSGPYRGEVVNTEVPTAAEKVNAAYAGGDQALIRAREAARESVAKKAHAWAERIYLAYGGATGEWRQNGGVSGHSIVLFHHLHPKFTGSSEPEAFTHEWEAFDWLQIRVAGYEVRPDGPWASHSGEAWGKFTMVKKGTSSLRYTLTHEVAHETERSFHRDVFGPGDHPIHLGKNPGAKKTNKILRGIIVP